jgi:serine/arginine repetitive matrix protein 2
MSQRFSSHNRFAARPTHPGSRYEHSDRWSGRPSNRSRSPPPQRDRRDSRDFGPPRDIHTDRGPRYARDGPLSAGPNPPDHARYQPLPPPPYGRGRGRPPEWDFRGRRPYPDERDNFRRSPSRDARRERQGSVESRDFDRRDDRRDDYRDRHDEGWRFRRREDFIRRDPPMRHPSDARSDTMPSPIDRGGRPHSPLRRPSPVEKREYDTSRRASTIDHPVKESRRESDRSDGVRTRDRSPERQPSRPAEETASVAVPQFGFIPPVLPTTPATPIKNPISPTSAKSIPTAPRAHLTVTTPPTGPKAERIPDRPIANIRDSAPIPTSSLKENVKPREVTPLPAVNVQPATSPVKQELLVQELLPMSKAHVPDTVPSANINQLVPPAVPTGPRSSSQPLGRASSVDTPSRDVSPSHVQTGVVPSGPRASISQASSIAQAPKGLPDNIPTGPRAMNRAPPIAPRNHRPGQTSMQWRPLTQSPIPPRAPSLPIKRDANGDEKERTPMPERPFDPMRISPSAPFNMRKPSASPVKSFATLPGYSEPSRNEDTTMLDAPLLPTSPVTGKGYLDSEDDEDQGLTEEDFREQAEIFAQKKARLEAQIEQLDRRHRATTPLLALDKGNAILAYMDELSLPSSPEPPPRMLDIPMAEDVPPTKSPTPEEPPSPARSRTHTPAPIPKREMTPEMSKSPDFEYLPYLPETLPTPISNPENGEDVEEEEEDCRDLVAKTIESMELKYEEDQKQLLQEYRELYVPWKKNAVLLDKERPVPEPPPPPTQMRIEIPEPSIEPVAAPLTTPNESRRLHKYSSEFDLERVLEESRREAELRQQTEEKAKKEALAHVEREAGIPPLLAPLDAQQQIFTDTSLLRDPEESLRVFEFAPPEDTLTLEQTREFTKCWKRTPKSWHSIADTLGLSTKDIIYHYYATKWDKPYKVGKGKKQKRPTVGSRRGGLMGRVRMEVDSENQDTAVGLTESGRPRRAAAPTFSKPAGKGEVEGEAETPTPTGRRAAGNYKADNGASSEGRGAGRGKTAKEKQPRKPRNPPLAAKTAAAASPQKIAKEKKDKPASVTPSYVEETAEWIGKVEPVPPQEGLMPPLIPQQQQQQPQPYLVEPVNMVSSYPDMNPNLNPLDPASAAPQGQTRPRAFSNTQKQNASSYWSVTEEQEFQACLAYYGTDFQSIANHITKKTPVMVRLSHIPIEVF